MTGEADPQAAGRQLLSRPGAATRWCFVKLGPSGAILCSKDLSTNHWQPAMQVCILLTAALPHLHRRLAAVSLPCTSTDRPCHHTYMCFLTKRLLFSANKSVSCTNQAQLKSSWKLLLDMTVLKV